MEAKVPKWVKLLNLSSAVLSFLLGSGFACCGLYLVSANRMFERWIANPDVGAGYSDSAERTVHVLFRFGQYGSWVSAAGFLLLSGWLAVLHIRLCTNRRGHNRVGTGIEPAPPTPPGMRIRTGRFPSVMAPEDDPLPGRSDTEC
jgi:hypothetical protein